MMEDNSQPIVHSTLYSMTSFATLQQIFKHQIVAIIRGVPAGSVPAVAKALKDGGVKLLEITLNSPGALTAIEALSKQFGKDLLIGAGTVLDATSARLAILAGAQFIISPSLDLDTIKMTRRYGAVSIPGAFTATEIQTAYTEGADIIKVFPASIGAGYFKELRGPLPHIPLMPTGGVKLENIKDFKEAGAVAYGIGGGLVKATIDVSEAGLAALTQNAKDLVAAVA